MAKQSLSQVVIVGRTNVGKSSLFNRLSTNITSLVLDQEGVTRDFVRDTVSWRGVSFELIDTGGFSPGLKNDQMQQLVVERAMRMIDQADVLVLVCDGTIGILPEDRAIAKKLRDKNIPVIIAVNKIDVNDAQYQLYEFNQLGFDTIIPISAAHGTGVDDLLEHIVELIGKTDGPTKDVHEEPVCRVAIVGKPNVGKSSLLNALLKEDRAIVSDIAGTTREPLTERIQFCKESFEITDTPGVRKKSSVQEKLEEMMVKTTMHALKEANVILYVVDGSQGVVSDQELKLLFYAFQDQYKAIIILFNKQDIISADQRESLERSEDEYAFFFKRLMTLSISCKTGKNIGKIIPLVQEVWRRYSQKLSDHELTVLCKDALMKKPLFNQQQELKLYRVEQVKTAPITLVFQVNQAHLFGTTQLAFFERIIRSEYDLRGVPLRLLPRTKS